MYAVDHHYIIILIATYGLVFPALPWATIVGYTRLGRS